MVGNREKSLDLVKEALDLQEETLARREREGGGDGEIEIREGEGREREILLDEGEG